MHKYKILEDCKATSFSVLVLYAFFCILSARTLPPGRALGVGWPLVIGCLGLACLVCGFWVFVQFLFALNVVNCRALLDVAWLWTHVPISRGPSLLLFSHKYPMFTPENSFFVYNWIIPPGEWWGTVNSSKFGFYHLGGTWHWHCGISVKCDQP